MNAWEPAGGPDEFFERVIYHRGLGKNWRKIASLEDVPYSTLYNWFKRNPEWKKEVEARSKKEVIENLRQTAIEMAITKKDRVMIIYLLKALAHLYDVPRPPEDNDKPKEPLFPGMTKEEAKKRLEGLKQ